MAATAAPLLAVLAGCAHALNDTDPAGPRYTGRHAVADPDPVLILLWSWDHVFVRGLALSAPGRVGAVRDRHGASDHRPVWVELAPPAAPLSPAATRP